MDQWYHVTASSRVCSMCSEHEEQRRLCSPESWVSHQCQLARWCARFTTCGLGCEGACGMWSLRHFVAPYARILIVRTEHVRCRGGQQQRQQIATYAAACEFVARLWGESKGGEQAVSRIARKPPGQIRSRSARGSVRVTRQRTAGGTACSCPYQATSWGGGVHVNPCQPLVP